MGEKPKRSMTDDLKETAEKVAEYPIYMRTQSSATRFERDRRRLGYDPRFGRPVVAQVVSEQELAAHNAKPSTIATREVRDMWESGDAGELRMDNDHGHSQNNPPLMPWDLKS